MSRWSPCRITWLFLAVPPQAHTALSFFASCPRLVSLSLRPSIMVTARPHLRVSRRTLILCCSLLISPQTHMSRGSPHIGQISAMALTLSLVWGYLRFSTTPRACANFERPSRGLTKCLSLKKWKSSQRLMIRKRFICSKAAMKLRAFSFYFRRTSMMCTRNTVESSRSKFHKTKIEETLEHMVLRH